MAKSEEKDREGTFSEANILDLASRTFVFCAGRMAPWVKGLASKPDNPSSILRTHMVGETHLLKAVGPDLHMCTMVCSWMCMRAHTQINSCLKRICSPKINTMLLKSQELLEKINFAPKIVQNSKWKTPTH